jgi:hypothetical protein
VHSAVAGCSVNEYSCVSVTLSDSHWRYYRTIGSLYADILLIMRVKVVEIVGQRAVYLVRGKGVCVCAPLQHVLCDIVLVCSCSRVVGCVNGEI